jgi:hypothetical protein
MLSSEEQQQRAGAARLERLASLGLGPLLEVDAVGRALLAARAAGAVPPAAGLPPRPGACAATVPDRPRRGRLWPDL